MATISAVKSVRLPAGMSVYQREFKINYRTLLSVNPKTAKSEVETRILHLAPSNTSSVINVCKGAGNCRSICLHFAGNPVQMPTKTIGRIRRTVAYARSDYNFLSVLISSILYERTIYGDHLAVRLNGTSDIAWENISYAVTPEFTAFWQRKFNVLIAPGNYANIFEVLRNQDVEFYDYTKIERDWQYCKRLNYHLTFSLDGLNNKENLLIARRAYENGVKLAAAFNVKKGRPLPSVLRTNFLWPKDSMISADCMSIYDGDLSDYRPADPKDCSIIGLRFKLPHGLKRKFTVKERDNFCVG
jgi:hypothetical protein